MSLSELSRLDFSNFLFWMSMVTCSTSSKSSELRRIFSLYSASGRPIILQHLCNICAGYQLGVEFKLTILYFVYGFILICRPASVAGQFILPSPVSPLYHLSAWKSLDIAHSLSLSPVFGMTCLCLCLHAFQSRLTTCCIGNTECNCLPCLHSLP